MAENQDALPDHQNIDLRRNQNVSVRSGEAQPKGPYKSDDAHLLAEGGRIRQMEPTARDEGPDSSSISSIETQRIQDCRAFGVRFWH